MVELESSGEIPPTCADPIKMIDANALADLVGRAIASPDSLELKRAKLLRDISELLGAESWAVLSAPTGVEVSRIPRDFTVKMESRHFSKLEPDDISTEPSGTILWSSQNSGKGETVFVCLIRGVGRPHFSAREKRLFGILVEEIPWLYRETTKEPSSPCLPEMSPRRRSIFDLLRQGYDRKEIAEQLSISVHTVSDHQKAIYRQLQVNSQIALMRNYRYP